MFAAAIWTTCFLHYPYCSIPFLFATAVTHSPSTSVTYVSPSLYHRLDCHIGEPPQLTQYSVVEEHTQTQLHSHIQDLIIFLKLATAAVHSYSTGEFYRMSTAIGSSSSITLQQLQHHPLHEFIAAIQPDIPEKSSCADLDGGQHHQVN